MSLFYVVRRKRQKEDKRHSQPSSVLTVQERNKRNFKNYYNIGVQGSTMMELKIQIRGLSVLNSGDT